MVVKLPFTFPTSSEYRHQTEEDKGHTWHQERTTAVRTELSERRTWEREWNHHHHTMTHCPFSCILLLSHLSFSLSNSFSFFLSFECYCRMSQRKAKETDKKVAALLFFLSCHVSFVEVLLPVKESNLVRKRVNKRKPCQQYHQLCMPWHTYGHELWPHLLSLTLLLSYLWRIQ